MEKQNIAKIFLYVWTGLLVGLFAKLFVVDFLKVQGDSMLPAIKDGSTVVVNKLEYGLQKPLGCELIFQWAKAKTGDVVIFLHNNKTVMKRCVAVAGDTIEYSFDLGYNLFVNKTKIPLTKEQYENLKAFDAVPFDTVFVCGDNYKDSVDSRDYGFVKNNCILAKVLCATRKSTLKSTQKSTLKEEGKNQ